jgi:hypothetical protein
MFKNWSSKFRLKGTIVFITGWLLSPLTWWNDIILNIPIAYFIANIINKILPGSFMVAMIVSYWATNLIGLLLMYSGGKEAIGKKLSRKDWIISLGIGIVYTVIMLALINKGWVKPLYAWQLKQP